MAPILIIGGILAFAAVIIVTATKAERERKRELGEAIAASGFQIDLKPQKSAQEEAFARLGTSQRLKTGAKGITWIASGEVAGIPVLLAEHRYIVSTGKLTSVHFHTIAATAAPGAWPTLTISPENLFHRIAEFFGSKDLKMEDENFNRRWRVKCEDENFALLALPPAVQEWFLKLPDGPWVEIGQSAVCVVSNSKATRENSLRFVRLLAEFVGMLPAELGAYGTARA